MSKFNNIDKKTSFLMTATTRDLLDMDIEVIKEEVSQHFNDLKDKCQKADVPAKVVQALDRRTAHTAILLAEAKRLAETHPELAEKLFVASLYWQETRAFELIAPAHKAAIQKRIEEIEEEKRKKAEEEKKKRLAMR